MKAQSPFGTDMKKAIDSPATPVLTLVNPPGLYDPTANGYSHVALVAPNARIAFIAGQGGESEDGTLSDDFQVQVRQAFFNLRTALNAAGANFDNVAKLTVLVVNHNEDRLRVFSNELAAWCGDAKPACTLIPVPRLALDGMLFEVEAIAVLPG